MADGCSEQEGADHLIKGGQVLVELGVGVQTLCVHKVGLSRGDLWSGHPLRQVCFHRTNADVGTHNDDGAGDGHSSHASMGDGVSPVRIADAFVIAVDSSLVWLEHQRQNG